MQGADGWWKGALRDLGLALLLTLVSLGAASALAAEQRLAVQGRVELWADGAQPDTQLARLADEALAQLEALTGLRWAERAGERPLRLVVSARTRFSHVQGGYDPHAPFEPTLYLNPRVAAEAVAGRDATYVHEIAHLLTDRFASHTLREGLADHLALQLLPGRAVGPNDAVRALDAALRDELLPLLGTSQPPPAAILQDPRRRAAYYAASQGFVSHLVAQGGLALFLQLYASQEPEAAYAFVYGQSREELLRAAFR